ncbi:YheC/YheD family protein [Paenibacillus lemnae]|uniref:YheC/YheD family protein n=1 Tax=Paenibacillus lemnae TaxID=1330551 RepID=A0A848M5V8_PAELE|nr:YheC/YheD family protein [Paenibacillus lemnae]NMO95639.1 YheC/YheD family protein [Paenibacillus lemnae]
MAARQLASKWLKTEALLSDPQIIPYIPVTKAFTADTLMSMVAEHGMVVIKPVVGTGGNGVIRVQTADKGYLVSHKGQTMFAASFSQLIQMITRIKLKRKYLIQQGIHLAKINGRPLDFRVKVVEINGVWQFRAMVGRLARRGLFVTNLCKGGTMLKCRPAIRMSLPHVNSLAIRNEMRQLTRNCIAVMESHFPGVGELGFDYGIDINGKIWILEVNTRPS